MFPLEVVGRVVNGENWVFVEGVVLDEYRLGAVPVSEQTVTEMSEQQLHETLFQPVSNGRSA